MAESMICIAGLEVTMTTLQQKPKSVIQAKIKETSKVFFFALSSTSGAWHLRVFLMHL